MNKKGFTLIELLAAMVILGIIMAVAVPNVMGILRNSRDNTYVSDSKKLISVAEYKFRISNNIKKPGNGHAVVLLLSSIDNSEFESAPNGNSYDKKKSYVTIAKKENKYIYSVQLVENMKEAKFRGVINKSYEELYNKKASELVENISESDLKIPEEHKTIAGVFIDEVYKDFTSTGSTTSGYSK